MRQELKKSGEVRQRDPMSVEELWGTSPPEKSLDEFRCRMAESNLYKRVGDHDDPEIEVSSAPRKVRVFAVSQVRIETSKPPPRKIRDGDVAPKDRLLVPVVPLR